MSRYFEPSIVAMPCFISPVFEISYILMLPDRDGALIVVGFLQDRTALPKVCRGLFDNVELKHWSIYDPVNTTIDLQPNVQDKQITVVESKVQDDPNKEAGATLESVVAVAAAIGTDIVATGGIFTICIGGYTVTKKYVKNLKKMNLFHDHDEI